MQLEEYRNTFQQEDTHWWYQSLYKLILDVLERLRQRDNNLSFLLDAGCGTGGMLKAVSEKFPTRNLVGVDISYHA